ncbi:hypothetical protein V8F33_008883 [Rhypophila sp. PSN 637]
MSPTFSHGAPLSPDYGTDDQGDLIWVPVRVPKGSSRSPPAQSPNFYQTPDPLPMQDASSTFLPPTSWGPDATMMSAVGSFPGITTSDGTVDWPSNELPMEGGFDAALGLELQAYFTNPQIDLGEATGFMNYSPEPFPGSDGSGALYGTPDFGLGLGVPNAFSPVESAWSAFETSYPTSSGSCSPATNMSPVTASSFYVPQISETPVPSQPKPTKLRPSCQRQRRASPTSPRDGGSSSGNSFACALCDKPHIDNRALSRHLWAQHPDYAARTKTKSERARCPQCDYSGRADNLARHMKRHAR